MRWWPFSRKPPVDTAATLIAAMLDADEDCSRWQWQQGVHGKELHSEELGATVYVIFYHFGPSLRLGDTKVPMQGLDDYTLTRAYEAWVERQRAAEHKRLSTEAATAVAKAIKSGAGR